MPKVRNDDPATLTLDLWNPKSIGFDSVEDCVKFQVILIMGFRFIVLTPISHIPTHIRRDKMIAMSSPYCAVYG